MANSVTARNALVAGIVNNATWVSVHTGDPGTTGASEAAGVARQQSTFPVPSGGSSTGSQVTSNVTAGGPYSHFGLWSAASGGTFYTGGPLSPAETFAGSGQLRITPTVSAT